MQGHIWRTGFSSNELEGVVFDDVPESLARWHALGVKVIPFPHLDFTFHSPISIFIKTGHLMQKQVNVTWIDKLLFGLAREGPPEALTPTSDID